MRGSLVGGLFTFAVGCAAPAAGTDFDLGMDELDLSASLDFSTPLDASRADLAPSPDMTPPVKRVFVTHDTFAGELTYYTGLFGGLESGDKLCQRAADAAKLGGIWKAWLSDDKTDAIDRIADVGPWYLVTRKTEPKVKVFENKANLKTVPLAPIDRDENGFSADESVWTGTQTGGTGRFVDNCKSWTTVGAKGIIGEPRLPADWTYIVLTVPNCTAKLSLYCFEQ